MGDDDPCDFFSSQHHGLELQGEWRNNAPVCEKGTRLITRSGLCRVCEVRPPIEPLVLPGVGAAVAVCAQCRDAGAFPKLYVIGQTAAAGGYERMNEAGRAMVDATLAYFQMERADFDEVVASQIDILERAETGVRF